MSGVLHGVLSVSRSGLVPATNPNFNSVGLLLAGSGTNGAQNNTFIDSSTNNFSVTRNGNTCQGAFSPYGTNWICNFDTFADSVYFTGVTVGTNQFCIEMWFRGNGSLVGIQSQVTGRLRLSVDATSVVLQAQGGTSYSFSISNSGNELYHLAVCRDASNNTTAFLNGVRSSTGTLSVTDNFLECNALGEYSSADRRTFIGTMSNVRIVVGSSVYDPTQSTITVPTAPLTAITNTQLLTFQDNRFIDNSGLGKTVTGNITAGTAVGIQRGGPVALTSAYDSSTIGGSGYFDGAGDYLSIADSATIRFGTGNFTIQAWVYRLASGAAHTIMAKGGASTGWVFQVTSTNILRFTHTTTNIDTTATVPAGAWTHVAAVRSGTGANQFKLYINGVERASNAISTDFNQTEQLNIGADRGNANTMNGYMSNIKYNVGTAETITVPTSPVTGGTILLNFINSGVVDSTMINDVETVDNAQISNSQSKWGGTSISFDGSTDCLLLPHNPQTSIRNYNCTIEGWVYINATGVAYGLVSKGTATTGWSVNITSGNKLQFSYTTSNLTGATSLAANTWYHFAVVRNGTSTGNVKIYLNGITDATSSTAITTDFNQTNGVYIGANRTGGESLNGYLQDVRISNSVAVYTANFIVPASAFPTF